MTVWFSESCVSHPPQGEEESEEEVLNEFELPPSWVQPIKLSARGQLVVCSVLNAFGEGCSDFPEGVDLIPNRQ